MDNKNYAAKLRDPRWQKKRLQILQRDKWACKLCGDTETPLQVHHKEYIKGNDPWDYPDKLLVTLCEHCHEEVSRKDIREVPFDKLKILKLNNWQGGSRIMFVTLNGEGCSMTVYNDNGVWVCGYNLNEDIPDIIKILRRAYNG